MNYEDLEDFVFYHSWVKYLDRKKDRQQAKEILWQIMRVGTGLGFDTEDEEIKDLVDSFIVENIKAAQNRYNSARNGGRPKINIDMARVHSMLNDGRTYTEIGKEFGVSEKTIQNRLKEEKETEKTGKKENTEENTTDGKKKIQDIDKDIDKVYTTTYQTVFDF